MKKSGWNSVWSDEHCYFLLQEGKDISEVSNRLPAFAKKFLGDNVNKAEYLVQPLSELHFDDRFGTYTYNTTSRGMLISLEVIALILVLTACINFINLATAEAIKRSKEVGIRKALGSSRAQLIKQFLGETTLITIISVLMSLGVTQLALTYLNPFLELNLALNFSTDTFLWIYLIGYNDFGFYACRSLSGICCLRLQSSAGVKELDQQQKFFRLFAATSIGSNAICYFSIFYNRHDRRD